MRRLISILLDNWQSIRSPVIGSSKEKSYIMQMQVLLYQSKPDSLNCSFMITTYWSTVLLFHLVRDFSTDILMMHFVLRLSTGLISVL